VWAVEELETGDVSWTKDSVLNVTSLVNVNLTHQVYSEMNMLAS